VIAGEIGSASASYTAIGEQVGMAQRLESFAPPGGVMLGESTSRLVENPVVLGDPEPVLINGADATSIAKKLRGARMVCDLYSQRVSHLAVRVRGGTGLVGPLDVSGVTSCLGKH